MVDPVGENVGDDMPRRRWIRPVTLSVIGALDSTALATLINVATGGSLPAPLDGHRSWVWPAIAIFAAIGIATGVAVVLPTGRSAGRRL
ncbi:MAG: hypothetical protein QOC94_522, partial [Actinoplanes sp.]|nr:hypothetical protein [Actinoplanes sp.]